MRPMLASIQGATYTIVFENNSEMTPGEKLGQGEGTATGPR